MNAILVLSLAFAAPEDDAASLALAAIARARAAAPLTHCYCYPLEDRAGHKSVCVCEPGKCECDMGKPCPIAKTTTRPPPCWCGGLPAMCTCGFNQCICANGSNCRPPPVEPPAKPRRWYYRVYPDGRMERLGPAPESDTTTPERKLGEAAPAAPVAEVRVWSGLGETAPSAWCPPAAST